MNDEVIERERRESGPERPPFILFAFSGLALAFAAGGGLASERPPNVLIVSVDTLRSDHLSAYGYSRATTPNLDPLIARGARFDAARTVEPLTGPALVSMLTSQHPHQHGANRNGLRMRTGLASLPKALTARGYRTAAFVGNWTLRDKLSGLAEHFEVYEEVLTRRRWMGLIRKEADAEDLTEAALDWLAGHAGSDPGSPFLLWVHYVEPHAPYRAHDQFRDQLGLPPDGELNAIDRYDTEIAFVDAAIGRLLRHVEGQARDERTIVVFTSDHGESLGEHGYWGHGRNLYEASLRIPLSITWPGRLAPRVVADPALLIDVAPTILGLLDQAGPAGLEGYDWSRVLYGQPAPADRETHYQAHRGAVLSKHETDLARRSGLLEVGVIRRGTKEIFRVGKQRREVYDLGNDPAETRDLGGEGKQTPSESVLVWLQAVQEGLAHVDSIPTVELLDDASAEMLRTLGYVD